VLRICRPKELKVTEELRELCNEEHSNFCSSSNILRVIKVMEGEVGVIYVMHEGDDALNIVNMIKSRMWKWQGHVFHAEKLKNSYKSLVR
jgi:hypothetical protein